VEVPGIRAAIDDLMVGLGCDQEDQRDGHRHQGDPIELAGVQRQALAVL
jgi:hypothetical protein